MKSSGEIMEILEAYDLIRNPGDYFAAAVVRESGGRGSEKTKRQIHYPLLPKRAKRLPTPPTL